MQIFTELTAREKIVEGLRWIGVLPAALLGGYAASFLVDFAYALAAQGGGPEAGSIVGRFLRFLLHGVSPAALVLAGGKMAPRGRRTTSVVLAVANTLMALYVHVLLRRHPGLVNYLDFAAESAGAILGVACVVFLETTKRMRGS